MASEDDVDAIGDAADSIAKAGAGLAHGAEHVPSGLDPFRSGRRMIEFGPHEHHQGGFAIDLARHSEVIAQVRGAALVAGRRVREVIDTAAGLWSIAADDGDSDVQRSATTPTRVFRALCGLLPDTDELAAP